jgi:hypothetical protein
MSSWTQPVIISCTQGMLGPEEEKKEKEENT